MKSSSAVLLGTALTLIGLLPTIAWAQPSVRFTQYHSNVTASRVMLTNRAEVSFDYLPAARAQYVNVAATRGSDLHWVVRNLFLPSAAWVPENQQVSAALDLAELGNVIGTRVSAVNYAMLVTDTVIADSSALMSRAMIAAPVDT